MTRAEHEAVERDHKMAEHLRDQHLTWSTSTLTHDFLHSDEACAIVPTTHTHLTTSHWAASLTNERLASDLRLLSDNIRARSVEERAALLYEAATRIMNGSSKC